MIALLMAFLQAASAALKAYAAHTEWRIATHKETTINALEDEKTRLADSGTPTDMLRLEVIAARLKRARDQ